MVALIYLFGGTLRKKKLYSEVKNERNIPPQNREAKIRFSLSSFDIF